MNDFCKIYAMNTERRSSLLNLLELTDEDHSIGQIFHQILLDEQMKKIVEDFYVYLLKHDQYTLLLAPDLILNLKQTQLAYLRGFGVDFDSSEYFNSRLQIGFVHKKVGLTLDLYQCAYRQLQQLMLDAIPSDFMQEGVCKRDLHCFIHKITVLDMTLAIETYHNESVLDIQNELDEAHNEKAVLSKQVVMDSLTGLFSKDYGLEQLNHFLLNAEQRKQLCLIMADIDLFKAVNDTYGHLAGDEVLRQIGKLLRSAVRDFDVVCRFGGEEFMILLTRTTSEIAIKVAERIRLLVKETPIHFNGHDIQITISQGLAVPDSDSDALQLLNKADLALYDAKDKGRDCVVMSGADVTRN